MPIESSLLARLPLFSNLPTTEIEAVATQSQAKRFPAMHMVMAHHSLPAFLIVVLRGQIQKTESSEDGRITGVSLVKPGEVVDWLSVIDGAPIISSISTTQETDLLLVPINLARDLLNKYPTFSVTVLRQLAQDVRRATEQRQLLTLPNAFQRVFVQIVQLAEQSPGQPEANLPKQHELAAMVNTSRETVSRAIQMLLKQGILVKHGHRFVVQGTDKLKQLAASGSLPAPANKAEPL